MTNNLLKSINERAENVFPIWPGADGNWYERQAYISGATSMLPVIEDVAVKLIQWSYTTEGQDWMNTNLPASYTAVYQHFLTNIYKPQP